MCELEPIPTPPPPHTSTHTYMHAHILENFPNPHLHEFYISNIEDLQTKM